MPKVTLNEKELKVMKAVEDAGDFQLAGAGEHLFPEADKAGKNTDGSLKSDSWVRNNLRKLVKTGLVKQAARGLYKATGKQYEAADPAAPPRMGRPKSTKAKTKAKAKAKAKPSAKAKAKTPAKAKAKASASKAETPKTKKHGGGGPKKSGQKYDLVTSDLPSDMPADDEADSGVDGEPALS